MTTNYCPEYVEALEQAAEQMAHALQLQQCIYEKAGEVSPEVTAGKIETAIDDYYAMKRDYSNE